MDTVTYACLIGNVTKKFMQTPVEDREHNFSKKYYSTGVILSGIYIVIYWFFNRKPFVDIVKTTAFFILLSSITLEIFGAIIYIIPPVEPKRGRIMYFAEKGYNKARIILAGILAQVNRSDNEEERKKIIKSNKSKYTTGWIRWSSNKRK